MQSIMVWTLDFGVDTNVGAWPWRGSITETFQTMEKEVNWDIGQNPLSRNENCVNVKPSIEVSK